MTPVPERPSELSVWLQAIRPRTLGASLVPVAVGTAAAFADGAALVWVALCTAACAALLQIGTNLANDALDFLSGIDGEERRGPVRVVQAGWLDARTVLRATAFCFGLAVVLSLPLVWRGGPTIVATGLVSLIAAHGYSGAPLRLASRGLGEAAAFLFFGPVAVIGTTYIHELSWSPLAAFASLPIGCLVTVLMAVNNLRDLDSDRQAGKLSLAVRIGPGPMRGLIALLLLLAFAAVAPLFTHSPLLLLPLLALPLGSLLWRDITRANDAPSFGRALMGSARLHGIYGVLLVLSLVL